MSDNVSTIARAGALRFYYLDTMALYLCDTKDDADDEGRIFYTILFLGTILLDTVEV